MIKMTDLDQEALELVRKSGFVTVDTEDGLCLETDGELTVFRLGRLVALGKLVPNGDGLFEGITQTYRIADGA